MRRWAGRALAGQAGPGDLRAGAGDAGLPRPGAGGGRRAADGHRGRAGGGAGCVLGAGRPARRRTCGGTTSGREAEAASPGWRRWRRCRTSSGEAAGLARPPRQAWPAAPDSRRGSTRRMARARRHLVSWSASNSRSSGAGRTARRSPASPGRAGRGPSWRSPGRAGPRCGPPPPAISCSTSRLAVRASVVVDLEAAVAGPVRGVQHEAAAVVHRAAFAQRICRAGGVGSTSSCLSRSRSSGWRAGGSARCPSRPRPCGRRAG